MSKTVMHYDALVTYLSEGFTIDYTVGVDAESEGEAKALFEESFLMRVEWGSLPKDAILESIAMHNEFETYLYVKSLDELKFIG